jgi:sugar O-acyltransferase (sialic acid O-acetyltransferase NeuD family)
MRKIIDLAHGPASEEPESALRAKGEFNTILRRSDMRELVGVYGSGGCGRGILPLIRDELRETSARLVFIDDGATCRSINGHEVLTWQQFLTEPATQRSACLAIASPEARYNLAEQCHANGIKLRGARAHNVVQMDEAEIGEGACLSPFVTITSNVRIGRCFHANLYAFVEHDCIIGDFVTLAPGAKCNGNIVIEDFAYIGSGAVIKQGQPGHPLVIGHGATVGMGAVVTKSVAAGSTVAGNPAAPLVPRTRHGARQV